MPQQTQPSYQTWSFQPQQQNMAAANEDPDKDKGDGTDGGDQGGGDKGDKGGDENLGDAGKRALQAERDARAAAEKRAKDAEDKLAEADKAKLGEKERAEVERDEARKERDEARAEAVRLKVGVKYGLSPEDVADLSTAGTADDFDARAKRLSERLKTSGDGKGSGRPKSDTSQGKGNGSTKTGGSVAAAREEHLASRAKK